MKMIKYNAFIYKNLQKSALERRSYTNAQLNYKYILLFHIKYHIFSCYG